MTLQDMLSTPDDEMNMYTGYLKDLLDTFISFREKSILGIKFRELTFEFGKPDTMKKFFIMLYIAICTFSKYDADLLLGRSVRHV